MRTALAAWLAAPLAAAALFVLWPDAAWAQKSPYTAAPQRDKLTGAEASGCPPRHNNDPVPGIAEDRTNRDGTTDYYMGKYHWDDGKGNDLTIIEWCMHGEVQYFSVEVIQSKNGTQKDVANPGGTGGAVDTDGC